MAKKTKKGKGKYYVAGACGCAIALFLASLGLDIGGLGTGLGLNLSGNGNGNGYVQEVIAPISTDTVENPEDTTVIDTETETETVPTGQETAPVEVITLVTVSGTDIIYDGRTVTIAQLRGILENIDNITDLDWTLHNEHAILDTIMQVRELFRNLDITPLETRA